jgi:hypothetical protein
MSFGVVATVVGAGAAVAGVSEARKGRKDAKRAAKNELAFAQQQYDDWFAAFGDIQQNLSNYYQNLTPAFIESQELQAFEQEKAATLENVRTTLEQRGISTSGLAGDIEKDIEISSAAERAKIRAEAPMKAATEQRDFLQVGLGQNPAGNLSTALGRQTELTAQRSQQATAGAVQAVGGAIDTTFNQLSSLLTPKQSTPAPVQLPAATPMQIME